MTGRFIAVVGPSGVGKDSVMRALAKAEPRLACVRRVITRAADAGAEDFEAVSNTEFKRMRESGAFALWWVAHGLHYAIPNTVDAALASGQDMLANLSRSVLAQASNQFKRFDIISLTASPQALRQRLTERGREDDNDISRRLARASLQLPPGISAIEIDNSGPLENAVSKCLDHLYPRSENLLIS